jgi:hypothetical protein
MGLVISKGLTLRKGWQPMDPDAAAYITAVETADGQALEEKTKIAIDNFVLGCKADGIWTAIKASCILAGARTRLGALTPLVGTAPTSFNFVDGDYNRKTGLVGDGSTKYLNSNRNNDADPQDSKHASCFVTTVGNNLCRVGMINNSVGGATIIFGTLTRLHSAGSDTYTAQTGFTGINRNSSISYERRTASSSTTVSKVSQAKQAGDIGIFRNGGSPENSWGDPRLAFYSIGESLDLALLDARVTDLINAFGAAIP